MGHDYMCKIDSLINTFVCGLACEVDKNGLECVNAEEAGAAADIIKDLSAALKDLKEAEYYSLISDAMEDANDDYDDMTRHGKERTHISAWIANRDKYNDDMHSRMGYTETHKAKDMHSMPDRYGKAYHDYMESKHRYSDTHSQADKDEMEMHVNEHLMDTMTTIKEIAKGVDPDMRKRIKSDLTKLVGDIPT